MSGLGTGWGRRRQDDSGAQPAPSRNDAGAGIRAPDVPGSALLGPRVVASIGSAGRSAATVEVFSVDPPRVPLLAQRAVAGPGGAPVVVINDHELFSTALTLALRSHGLDARGLEITGGTETTILTRIAALPAGLALLDLRLGADGAGCVLDGLELIAALRARGWSVLVVSATRDPRREAAAIAAGAIGLVSKSSPFATLLATVRSAAAGEPVMSEVDRQYWLARHRGYQTQHGELARRLARLSAREREVLALLGQGYRAAAIAQTSVVSLTTVRTQIRAILTKLEVNSQLEAVALASNHTGF